METPSVEDLQYSSTATFFFGETFHLFFSDRNTQIRHG